MDFRRVAYMAGTIGLILALAGCAFSFFGYERRAAWRDKEERACMSARVVRASAYIQPGRGINDRGSCGIFRPIKVSALVRGSIAITPTAMINCPMTASVEKWLNEAVQPAAVAWFGAPVVGIKQISAYACRPKNNEQGASLSEHAFGNALDVAGFRLADGRMITVKGDWSGTDPYARGFLREVLAAACERFKTVLGPGVKYHGDHFHIDLAHHNEQGTSRYCNPRPDGPAPRRGPYSPRGGGILAGIGGMLDMTRTGSVEAGDAPTTLDEIGELLDDMPQDVIDSEMRDPFGVSTMQGGLY